MRDPRAEGWPEAGERTELRDVAERWRIDYWRWCEDEQRSRLLGRQKPRTLGDMAEAYLRHREGKVAPDTVLNDQTALRHLMGDFSSRTSIYALEPQRTVDRMISEGYQASTVRMYAAFLSGFFGWMGVRFRVELPKPPERFVRVWTDAEIAKLRSMAGDLLLAVDLGLYMGLRQGEIYGVRWEDVSPETWTVRVSRQQNGRATKGGKARTALILPGWAHTGTSGPIAPPITRNQQHDHFSRLLDRAGLNEPGVRWHALRHSYARMFLERKPEMRLLQASLGHASVLTTERSYGHLLPDKAAELARRAIHGA